MDNRIQLRNFVIATIKRLSEEVDFLENLINVNEKIVDSKDDFVIQLGRVQNELSALLDYNFYPDEINSVDAYKVEVAIVRE